MVVLYRVFHVLFSFRHRLIREKKPDRQVASENEAASLTDMFNKMSKVSKPTRHESSEEMQQVHDFQDQVAITSSSIHFETSKGMYLL